MKTSQLPTKRQPVSRGVFRRLHAITTRKQRVAATATASELEGNDVPNLGVGRALIAILLVHVVAIGGALYHSHVVDGRAKKAAEGTVSQSAASASIASGENLPKLAKGEASYLLDAGDSYQSIAQAHNVDEQELRAANNNVPARAGRVFRLPPKKVVAVDPPEMAALHHPGNDNPETAEVPEVAVTNVPKAVVVRPSKGSQQAALMHVSNQSSAGASGHTCVVAEGDSIWRIASRNKVTTAALMKANGISDAHKIRPGMKLVLPANH
jgi:LysM repeat protein